MKLHIRIVILLLLAVLIVPAASRAAGIGLGVETWYSWWDPYWGKYKTSLMMPVMPMGSFYPPDNTFGIEIKSNFMYGPVLSANLPENFSLTARFLYGQFKATKKEQYVLNYLITDHIGLVKRYDADLMLRYQVHDLVYLKTGFKYVHFTHEIIGLSVNYFGFFAAGRIEKKNKYNEYAPVAGLGLSIPVVKDAFSIEIDAVFQFCFAKESSRQSALSRTEFSSDLTCIPPYTKNKQVKKLGMDARLNLSYRVPVIPLGISLGFRYNMYKRLAVERDKALEYEHQYGLTAMVDYRFEIGVSREPAAPQPEGL